MKKIVLFMLFVLLYFKVYSQDQDFNKKIKIGVNGNIGMNQPIRFSTIYETDEVGPFHSRMSYAAGVKFSRLLSQKIKIEMVGCYSVHKVGFELSPPVYPFRKIYTETFDLLSIIINVNRYLKNNYFLSLGTIIDFSLPRKSYWIDTQTGFGLGIAAGKEIQVKNITLDLSPNLEIHSVVPFSSVKYQQRLIVLGLRIGVGFNSH